MGLYRRILTEFRELGFSGDDSGGQVRATSDGSGSRGTPPRQPSRFLRLGR
jgi:hypothetical protein